MMKTNIDKQKNSAYSAAKAIEILNDTKSIKELLNNDRYIELKNFLNENFQYVDKKYINKNPVPTLNFEEFIKLYYSINPLEIRLKEDKGKIPSGEKALMVFLGEIWYLVCNDCFASVEIFIIVKNIDNKWMLKSVIGELMRWSDE